MAGSRKFKIGDKVALVGPSNVGPISYAPKNAIIDFYGNEDRYRCKFISKDSGKNTSIYFPESSLEKLRIRDTKIARKVKAKDIDKIEE